PTGMQIVRGDNRDKSGINGDFLCIKGRYAFDFANHDDRITQPLIRRDGRHMPATYDQAYEHIALRLKEIREQHGGQAIGVIGSIRTSNEENYLLQKFARLVLGTNNIDHHRTADFPAFAGALAGKNDATASMRDVFNAPAILLVGNDPTEQHPLLAWQIRNNVRLHRARLYLVNSTPIKLRRQAASFTQIPAGNEPQLAAFLAGDDSAASALASGETSREALTALRDKLRGEHNLVIIFGSELRGREVESLVRFGSVIPGARFICLGDYANSRGAADMGLYPGLLPGYVPIGSGARFHEEWGAPVPTESGLNLLQMVEAAKAGSLRALYVVGANPVARFNIDPFALSKTFTVVHDMFLTETALLAEVILPAANAYEKSGTFTNTCGDLQLLKKAGDISTVKSDFEMLLRVADRMGFDLRRLVPFRQAERADLGQSRGVQSGEADRHAVWLEAHGLEPKLSPFDPIAMLDEIQRLVPGYDVSRVELLAGNDQHTAVEEAVAGSIASQPELIAPANDTLFTSGTLGRYSRALNSVIENPRRAPVEKADKEAVV
ncbi:MAG TPA: molybdopterin-dependent oxidoreductase, partial [Terriglobales bacterium]|nr:molybdopterin-dependent oxidoreductase [Terriglobales bacterium]